MTKKPITEKQLIDNSLKILRSRGHHVWRQPNIGRFDVSEAKSNIYNLLKAYYPNPQILPQIIETEFRKCWRKVPNNLKGVPDIIGFDLEGKFIGCEIKTGGDRLSLYQKELLNKLHQRGGGAFVVRDIDKFENTVTNKYGGQKNLF